MRPMKSASFLSTLAGSAAVALAFNAPAQAAGLIDDDAAILRYRPQLSEALALAAKDDFVRGQASSLALKMERALKEPADKNRLIVTPDEATESMLQLGAVVPAKGLENESIPVCMEKSGKVLGTFEITPKGNVVTAAWNGSTVAPSPDVGACQEFFRAQSKSLKAKLAQQQAPAPTTATVVTVAAIKP